MIVDTDKLEVGVYAIDVFEKDRPLIQIDPDQAWFWTPEWLKGELQAEEDIKNGNYKSYDNIEDFINDLGND